MTDGRRLADLNAGPPRGEPTVTRPEIQPRLLPLMRPRGVVLVGLALAILSSTRCARAPARPGALASARLEDDPQRDFDDRRDRTEHAGADRAGADRAGADRAAPTSTCGVEVQSLYER